MEPQAVMDEISAATLRGRGGAGFPMGRKASLLAKDTGKPVYLVVNADESEPGAFKDRDVMRHTPHRLIEGCLITAHGIGSRERLHLHPRRVPARVRGHAGRPRRTHARRSCSAA